MNILINDSNSLLWMMLSRTSLLVRLSEPSLVLWLELVAAQLWVVQGQLVWPCPQSPRMPQVYLIGSGMIRMASLYMFDIVWSCLIILLDWMDLGWLGCSIVSERAGYFSWCPWRGLNAAMQHGLELAQEQVYKFRVHSSKHSKDYNVDRLPWYCLAFCSWILLRISNGFFPVRTFQSLTLYARLPASITA